MSDTPRTDAIWNSSYDHEYKYHHTDALARSLERELAAERLKRQQAEHERDSELEALAGSQREQAGLREALNAVAKGITPDMDTADCKYLCGIADAALREGFKELARQGDPIVKTIAEELAALPKKCIADYDCKCTLCYKALRARLALAVRLLEEIVEIECTDEFDSCTDIRTAIPALKEGL